MSRQTNTAKWIQHTSLFAVALALAACTKARDPKVMDEKLNSQLVPVSDFIGARTAEGIKKTPFWVQTADQSPTASEQKQDKALLNTDKNEVSIKDANTPESVKAAILRTAILGEAGKKYPVIFRLEGRDTNAFVTMYRIVQEDEKLSSLEQQLMRTEGEFKLLPALKIKVARAGILKKTKNDLGEETSTLNLYDTALNDATHVQLSLDSGVTAVRLTLDDPKGLREIYKLDDINNRIMTVKEANDLFQTELDFAKNDLNKKILTVVDRSRNSADTSLFISFFEIKKRTDISDRDLLAKLDGSQENKEIAYCSASLRNQLGLKEKADCVLVLNSSFNCSFVQAKLKNQDGVENPDITFENTVANAKSPFVRIVQGSIPKPAGLEKMRNFSPLRTIKVSDIKNKEFFYRRTYERGNIGSDFMLPGVSGTAELVTFEMEKTQLVVRKVLNFSTQRVLKPNEREPLLSVPAKYYKTRNAKGDLLNDYEETTPESADTILVDWTDNSLRTKISPLGEDNIGFCAKATGPQTISSMDNRPGEGKINFTVESIYMLDDRCQSYKYFQDYSLSGFDAQANFTVFERISFRLNDKSKEAKKAMNLPFPAQNMLGFGVWTMGVEAPDKYGNAFTTQDLKAMPILHDFTNGKTLTYTLGNLDEHPEYKEIIVRAARTVIKDWNASLHMSFKGTSLDRTGDYILLEESAGKSVMGDLDKNFIWNDWTESDSSALGVAQIGFNPRNGSIEAANVVMWNHNLVKYLGYARQKALIEKKYREFKKNAFTAAYQKLEKAKQEVAQQQQSSVPEATIPFGGGKISGADKKVMDKLNRSMQLVKDLKDRELKAAINPEKKNRISDFINKKEDAILHRVITKILELPPDQQARQSTLIVAQELLKTYKGKMSADVEKALMSDLKVLTAEKQMADLAEKNMGCLFINKDITSNGLYELDLNQAFEQAYRNALVHEIGHTLGLTHNFRASLDKDNFEFGPANNQEKTGRTYSSVMDYIPDEFVNYHGPGPYDVFAIRAGYTGYLELGDQVALANKIIRGNKTYIEVPVKDKSTGKVSKQNVELADGKSMHIDDWAKIALGEGESLWTLKKSTVDRFPIKKFDYCTDQNVGMEPLCARHDHGTTVQEIVSNHIQDLENSYPYFYEIGSRIRFGSPAGFFGYMVSQLLTLRQFFDEALYQSVVENTEGQDRIGEYQLATMRLWRYLLHTAATPESQLSFWDPNRFSVASYQVNEIGPDMKPTGKKIEKFLEIESRISRDNLVPGWMNTGTVRGFEIMKALAMEILTLKGTGNYRYEFFGLRVSMVDWERGFFEEIKSSPTLNFIESMLLNNPKPFRIEFDDQMGGLKLVELSPAYSPGYTQFTRIQALIASQVNLESNIVLDTYNLAAQFRFGSAVKFPPADRYLVSNSDVTTTSPTSQKFYAYDNAEFAKRIIRQVRKLRPFVEEAQFNELKGKFKILLNPDQKEEVKAQARKDLVDAMVKINMSGEEQKGLIITKEQLKDGETFESFFTTAVADTEKSIRDELDMAGNYLGASKSNSLDKAEVRERILFNKQNMLIFPLLAPAAKAALESGLMAEKEMSQIFEVLMNPDTVKESYDQILGNIQIMNQIMTSINPSLQGF